VEPLTLAVVAGLVGAVVIVPLAREYADLRQAHRLSRAAALATLALIFPSFAAASALAAPLAERPGLHWLATVTATLVLYSLATRAIAARASAVETAPSRRI